MVKTFCARRNETEKLKLYLFSLPTKVHSESHVGKKLELLVSTEKENLLRHNFPPRTESNFFSPSRFVVNRNKRRKKVEHKNQGNVHRCCWRFVAELIIRHCQFLSKIDV